MGLDIWPIQGGWTSGHACVHTESGKSGTIGVRATIDPAEPDNVSIDEDAMTISLAARKLAKSTLLTAALMLPVALAYGHPGATADHVGSSQFLAGVLHPLTGIDHLLAFAGLGLWFAARHGLHGPGSLVGFILSLASGFGLALVAIFDFSHAAEILSSMTSLSTGLLLVLGWRNWSTVAVARGMTALVALSGLGHGYLFASEIPDAASASGFLAGMTLSSMGLFAAGLAVGRLGALRLPALQGIAGVVLAAFGAVFGLQSI